MGNKSSSGVISRCDKPPFAPLFIQNLLMIRWFVVPYLDYRDFVKFVCISKSFQDRILSHGDFAYLDQEHIKRMLRRQGINQKLYGDIAKSRKIDIVDILGIYVK